MTRVAFARVSVCRPVDREVGRERYPCRRQCVCFIIFPFAPISLLRIRKYECPRITMPLRASSEELTSDRDSKNGGVSMRRPSSVRDSITASMPRYVFKHRNVHRIDDYHHVCVCKERTRHRDNPLTSMYVSSSVINHSCQTSVRLIWTD